MDFNAGNARTLLGQFEFAKLFVEELGWDRHRADLSVPVTGTTFELQAVAEKRGMVAWVCQAPAGQQIPDRATRKKIETQVARTTLEHLVIFTDSKRAEQIWCWARREVGKPASVPEHFWYASSGNRGFLQRLEAIAFSLAEESTLTLVDVTARARAAFDVERVTKRFYDRFKTEHEAFLDFISGITDLADKEWYASLMLNRLMFIYFMQRKGFLNAERDYLRDRLAQCQKEKGEDKFYSFYRYFLMRLFHEGLGAKARNPELDKLLGRIPYLNGGLFEKHSIEERYPEIRIPDEAFTRIFSFFDRYQWHLDERPLRDDNEINPDVLGYIFEKYINQKQMGAYYTKEDITEYISKNAVIPFLFDAAEAKCKVAFKNPGGPTIWDNLRDDPDRYIYTAVKHGAELALPPDIAAGIEDVSARTRWNQKAPAELGLPTEIWREVVARRTRYAEVRAKLATGKVREINDLITLNLDIRQFGQDVIERCEGPDLLRAFWNAIEGVTVLDPTCGSGAFLFAALNILEPLYETCLDRMEAFIADLERLEGHAPKRFEDFKATLAKVRAHPNARYFTLKSIILNNLFGVDIMEEAVEICKLRLFLKLAAQVDPDQKHENLGIEPLPDIDFNIRAGNTLVGYATYADVRTAMLGKLDLDNSVERIKRSAADLQQLSDTFRARQIDSDGSVPAADKLALRQRLRLLGEELNQYLASEYGVSQRDKVTYSNWVNSHRPFHWFIEFHGVLSAGGFDVIIGNPPYVEDRKVDAYSVLGYASKPCGNLYAYVTERTIGIVSQFGRIGLILPLASTSVEGTDTLRKVLIESASCIWHASFGFRPAKLFDGVNLRLAILLFTRGDAVDPEFQGTRYTLWSQAEREDLFKTISFYKSAQTPDGRFLKIDHSLASSIFQKVVAQPSNLQSWTERRGGFKISYHRSPLYWIRAMDFEPYFWSESKSRSVHHFRDLLFRDEPHAKTAGALLNSALFYFWFVSVGNCRNLTNEDVVLMPVGRWTSSALNRFSGLFTNLMDSYKENSGITKRHNCEYQTFYPNKSKSILDDIDTELAVVYGFNEEELDFLTNFEIKYRMGDQSDEEGDDGD